MGKTYEVHLFDRMTGVIPNELIGYYGSIDDASEIAMDTANRYCMDGEPLKCYFRGVHTIYMGDGNTGVIVLASNGPKLDTQA